MHEKCLLEVIRH